MREAAECLAAGRRSSTWAGYASKMASFVNFCEVVLPSEGYPAACPLPARTSTVLAYLGWLREQDSVHHGSLQTYFTAINAAHADAGFHKPATGQLFGLARKGFGELEADERGVGDRRVVLPARIAAFLLDVGLKTDDNEILRETAAIVTTFSFFARGDTGARAEAHRLVVDENGMHFNEDAKNLLRMEPETLSIPWPEDRVRSPHALLQRFRHSRELAWARAGRATPDALWHLPDDAAAPKPSCINTWLTNLLTVLGVRAPPGVKWTGHSLRGGGATAALAIGVSLPAICRWGIWKSLGSLMRYLDPLVRDSEEARLFFAHLLRGSNAAAW